MKGKHMSIPLTPEQEKILHHLPGAHSVKAFLCDGCNRVHVVLLSSDGEPYAHFTVPDGPAFLREIIELREFAANRTPQRP